MVVDDCVCLYRATHTHCTTIFIACCVCERESASERKYHSHAFMSRYRNTIKKAFDIVRELTHTAKLLVLPFLSSNKIKLYFITQVLLLNFKPQILNIPMVYLEGGCSNRS